MIGQIAFTVIAFVLFIYILWLKMIKKNDTTYLIILGIQAIGILLNLIRIYFDVLNRGRLYMFIIYSMYNNPNCGFCVRNEKQKRFRNIKSCNGTNLYMV